MKTRSLLATAVAATLLAAPGAALAADRFEGTMGFLAGEHDHTGTDFTPSGSAPALTEPFRAAPFDRVRVFGLRYDARLVVSHVRMTAGFDLPFASVSQASPQRYGGRDVAAQSLRSMALRFGLGAEYPLGRLTPFVDLLGAVRWSDASLAVDGATADYAATSFGFSARAGLRAELRPWFFASAAGEVGLVGEVRWTAEVAVGFAIR